MLKLIMRFFNRFRSLFSKHDYSPLPVDRRESSSRRLSARMEEHERRRRILQSLAEFFNRRPRPWRPRSNRRQRA